MSDFQLFIDGEFCEAADGATDVTFDPSTGETIGTVAVAGREDAKRAIAAARTAFDDGRWSSLKGTQRRDVMHKIAKGISARADELGQLESRDAGATLFKAKGADVGGSAFWFRTMGDYAVRLDEPQQMDQTITPGPSYNYVRHEPVGVATAIIPWNFPLQMAAWKISMALAAGCSIVLKPALETPCSATILAEVIQEAGVPAGVVNIIPGPGPETGEELVTNPGVDKVSFTGSTAVGRHIQALAAETVKNVTLELGGKSAQLVLEGADLDLAVDGVLYSIFFHAGQACTAGSRLLLPESLHDEFVDRMVQRLGDIKVGPTSEKDTNVGPLINQKQLDRVLGYIETGKQEGATLVAGGERLTGEGFDDGFFVPPTIFTGVTSDMKIAQEEIFGPVLAVLKYQDQDEAITIANDSIYGLGGAVWGPPSKAMKVAHQLRTGTVWVNDYHLLNPKYPFGGYKQSGVGREHGWAGLLGYTETKHVHVAVDQSRATHRWFDMVVPSQGR